MADKAARAQRRIAENRRAQHEFELEERFEAGVVLVGSEVKVLREGRVQLAGAYVRIEDGEAWLYGLHIPEYAFSHQFNHPVERRRKLLLRRQQLRRLERALSEKGGTCIAVRLYFDGPFVKVEIALARGRRTHDKREAIKARDERRERRRGGRGR
jgi:SsrA-binding protein